MLAVASKAGSLLFQGGFSRSLHFVPVTLATRLPRGSVYGEQGPARDVGRTRASPKIRQQLVSSPRASALGLAGGTIYITVDVPLIRDFPFTAPLAEMLSGGGESV